MSYCRDMRADRQTLIAILRTHSGVFAFSILVIQQRTYVGAKEAMSLSMQKFWFFFQRIVKLQVTGALSNEHVCMSVCLFRYQGQTSVVAWCHNFGLGLEAKIWHRPRSRGKNLSGSFSTVWSNFTSLVKPYVNNQSAKNTTLVHAKALWQSWGLKKNELYTSIRSLSLPSCPKR